MFEMNEVAMPPPSPNASDPGTPPTRPGDVGPLRSTKRPAPVLAIAPEVVELLRSRLPEVADAAVNAIVDEVPSYTEAFSGHMGENIRQAVQLALGGFISLTTRPAGAPRRPAAPSLEGAYLLGRGEARSGRSMEALLAAYRVGSRESWRLLAAELVAQGVDAATVAAFAELVFAYMDQLSDASVSGHSDEVARSGRARQQLLDELGRQLLDGAAEETLLDLAKRADWEPPETLTAMLMPESVAVTAVALAPPNTLRLADPAGTTDGVVLLVPDTARTRFLRAVKGRGIVVGPTRPWTQVRSSYLRALRALELAAGAEHSDVSVDTPLDTEAHLARLVVTADPEALADLRVRVLAPLDGHTTTAREKLSETLRAWLLHQGRREAVAESLFVHPQTVRYRVGQLREAYGALLDDPDFVRDATIALG